MNVIDIILRQKPLIKVLVLVLILGAILGIYWQFFYKPVLADIRAIEPELTQLKQELSAKRDIVKEKPRYEAELDETRAKLHVALKQLPNKSEIPTLLENISALGKASGLTFTLFKPKSEVPKNFYAEIPVDLQIEGTYKDLVLFFDKISKMPRIVNITNITLSSPKKNLGDMRLNTSCNAITYKFIENSNPDTSKTGTAKKGEKK
ncbi:MAG: type 4a pilus biogenesis protein PilO [Deltaproteobacteria bacterium]|nr:type 4a pilus biogenesis protein PilO [Deltaproteobacteria bacterium]